MSRLTYAVITAPAQWSADHIAGTIHKHATDNGVIDLGGGKLLVEIPSSVIDVVEKEYQGTSFKVVELPAWIEQHVDVVRTHARQLYVQTIAAAQDMQDGTLGVDGTPMSQATLEAALDTYGVDYSGFTTPVQYRVALARSGNDPYGEPNARLGPPNWTLAQFSSWANTKTVAELAGFAWDAEIDVHNVTTLVELKQRIGEETGYA